MYRARRLVFDHTVCGDVTWLSVMRTQGQLQNALRACEVNSALALEQLERAFHNAAKIGLVKYSEMYKRGKDYLVPS